MLKRPVPTSRQALAGMLTVASLTLAAGFSAWAAQPPRSTEVTPAPPMASPGDAASSPVSPASAAPSGTNIRSATALPLGPGESRTPPPKYPADAIAKHQQGRVVLVVDIDKLGHPTAVKVEKSSPPGVFDAVTVEAAMKWRFTPEIKDGRPIASRVRVPVDFSIPEDERAAPAASADS